MQRLYICTGLLQKDCSYRRVHTTGQTQYDLTILEIPFHTGMLASLNEVCVGQDGVDIVLQRQHARKQLVLLALA